MAWSPGDIEAYTQVESEKLDKLYAKAGISASEPEKREKYLLEEYLKLSASDYNLILKLCEKLILEHRYKIGEEACEFNRRVDGLNLLEDIVIRRKNEKSIESKEQTS